ncbi:apolipoprotein N-acyltransferase [Pseudorhodoplanes sinuspersici]|uniref:Apolipoprotein N-acyltransferase n=1 Tax=Pseudorhodoplanes sinuspersici TaxID=1235591 RepID=A0A1W6ZQ63_9HYPH|nr:apolipoprotein N-acyltransferase [Pseudorhodoplanes sinuspersici]ARP99240.1 apolipoprotein N-acyltransferase [Pseudorhodoplanes sinuspersici]RKE69090.1 apolipoprotein N-acyltransferase [Pseudorhodoplanes sinuspersici]
MSISKLAHAIVLAWGWRRALIAFAAGAISVLALPPFDIWPVLFLTFPVAVWLIDGSGAARFGGCAAAALAGWFFGFGYFLTGLYWIGHAFLVDAKTFGWLLPIAVTALPAGLAIFTAAGFALARLLWQRGPIRILALAIALTVVEWLRGHLLSGFPWNSYGYALTGSLTLAQTLSVFGLWGMTTLSIAIFASPATLADEAIDTRRPWLPLALSVATLLVMAGYGTIRLANTPTEFVKDVRLRIMQPNLPQDEKFNYGARQKIMSHYLSLSDRATTPQTSGLRNVTHLIWPESAFPFFLTRDGDALAQIANLLPEGTILLTGAARYAEALPGERRPRAYNSVYAIDHDGAVLSVYDKVHLVPFGEYLPFQSTLERLGFLQLTKVQGGFLSGDRHRAYDLPRAPRFLPLICYEIVFPGAIVPPDDRPGWLLNVTNDAWFGISPGPYQHFQQARARAIEEGLPLVRAANNGISAVVDPLGRIIRYLPLGAEGVLDSPLPRPLEPTIYARLGNSLAGVMLLALLLVVLRYRVSKPR